MARVLKVVTIIGLLAVSNCGPSQGVSPPADVGPGDPQVDRAVPECAGHADCDDQDPCTDDVCRNGQCSHEAISCDDSNVCTDDWCGPQGCGHTQKPGCCLGDQDCDDQDPCTRDRCVLHACVHDVPDPTCCSKDEQCDDGNECTLDFCLSGQCRHQKVLGGNCCETDPDCFDSNPYTDELCVDGKCRYKNNGSGCLSDEDCDDLNPCTTGACNAKQKCEYVWKKGCCVSVEDCDDQNVCTTETCKSGVCEVTPLQNCCKDDGDCQVADPCKKGTCLIPRGHEKGECHISLLSSPECCTTSLVHADFDDGTLQGFTVESLYPGTTPKWVVDSRRFVSPPNALYFGDPATHTYDAGVGQPTGGVATSPEADLSKTWEPEVRFSLWKKTEVVASADVLSLRVVEGGHEHEVWSTALSPAFSDTNGQFAQVKVPLSAFSDRKVRIRFVFDTGNGFANAYEGVYLDDIEVVGRCL